MNERIEVQLGERSYPIHFLAEGLEEVGPSTAELHRTCRCAVVSDENVAPLYQDAVCASLEEAGFQPVPLVLPPGEEQKNLETIRRLYDDFLEAGLDRKSLAVALGGGVVGDITGFASATFMRGIPYVQAPTTLLAQVDSSVGGKTGVNLPAGKNLVGAFHQPIAVFICISTLKTLAERELKCGMVELVKYGIIRDEEFFAVVEQRLEELLALHPEVMISAVRRCCEIKAEVVSLDERENGLRAILNYGHTVGHAVESLTSYGQLRHGEAVSMGMVAAAELAREMDMLDARAAQRQNDLLARLGVPTTLPPLKVDALLERMKHDKKAVVGKLRFILARRIGEVEICHDVPVDVLRRALVRCGAN